MNPNTLRSLAFLATFPTAALAWSPGPSTPAALGGFSVDITQRNDVAAFYQFIYNTPSTTFAWEGDAGTFTPCFPGAPADSFNDSVLRRINFYRAMAQRPADITFDPGLDTQAQAAALATAANEEINHSLESSDACASPEAIAGARDGNLALGVSGPDAIDRYIRSDIGDSVDFARYRRGILNYSTSTMGTGDVPVIDGQAPAQSIFVEGPVRSGAPSSDRFFDTWPPSLPRPTDVNIATPSTVISYVPANLVPDLWSVQFWNKSPGFPERIMFAGAREVQMYVGSNATDIPAENSSPSVAVEIEESFGSGNGEFNQLWGGPGLAWKPDWSSNITIANNRAPLNRVIRVDIEAIGGVPDQRSLSFNIVLIDPDILTDVFQITGFEEIEVSGASYTFTPASAPGADRYDLQVVSLPSGDPVITSLGTATGFTLDAATAGGGLQAGASYELSIIPTIGGHTFQAGEPLTVAVAGGDEGFSTWLADNFATVPAAERGFEDDPDGDGSTNGIEYALGLDPTDPSDAPPAFTVAASGSTLTFDPSTRGYDTDDIGIRLLTSPDLSSPWTELSPGTDGITYTIPATEERIFYRWEVRELE